MNARAARWLTRLYPPAWRARYGEEFAPFLEARPVTLRDVLNVVGCALNERARVLGEFKMSKLQHSLVLAVYAYLAAIAAGLNLYMTVDDTPLVDAMSSHAALFLCWNLVAAGSLMALAAAAAVGLPAVWAMIRFAWTAKRRDIFVRLAVPPFAAMASIAGLFTWGWNPSRTLIVLVIGLFGSAISLKQAIERTTLPEQVRPLQLA